MARYSVYNLDGLRLVETVEIEADADSEAVQIAKERGRGDHVEIWQGSRKVRVVAPTKAARSGHR
jgi:hypothetical protein